MRYLVLADLHEDFWREAGRDPFAGIEDEIATLDLLVLAGDLSNKPKVRWTPALRRLREMMPHGRLAIFPGNHDFYQFRLDGEDRLVEFARAGGADYVNAREIHIGATRLLCATLWTDYELGGDRAGNEERIQRAMNDYRCIRVARGGYRPARPADMLGQHRAQRSWLETRLAEPHDGETIVVTHHAPHPDVLAQYSDGLDAAYASDLGDLIQAHAPDQWLFGHCHDARDIRLGATRVESVSLGYPDDVEDAPARIAGLIRNAARERTTP